MAAIRKRGGRWQVQVRRQGVAAVSKSFLDRGAALRWAREQELAIDRGEWTCPAQVSGDHLSALLSRYETEVSSRKRTKSDVFHLRQLARLLGRLPVAAITAERVARFRDERLKSVSGSTVRKELALLGNVLKIATQEWGLGLKDDPVAKVRKPPAGKARTRRLSVEDMRELDQALRQCRNDLIRPVFLFALATGMRRGEVLSLRWSNINWQDRTALLPITKNGEPRVVPLSPSALQVLQERQETAQKASKTQGKAIGELVFPISANALRLAWERVRRRAGVEDLRWHDLRHEAISRFFEMGLSVPEVALISGHKDARMLFRYTHLRPSDLAKKLAADPS